MALTWRNVEGPDFGRSLEGIRTFSDLFGGAIGGLDRGLSTFDASMDKTANAKFAMDLLKYQDPAQYKAALASGAVFEGTDPNRINQANIQAAGARTTDLLNQKIGEFGLTRDEYAFGRRQTTDANQDAAAPLIAGAMAAGRQGTDAFSKYMAANPALAKLGLQDASALATGALDAESRGVTIDQGRQGISQSAKRFGWESLDRATADQADAVMANLTRNGFDATDQLSQLNAMASKLDPKVYNALYARLGGGAGGGGGSASSMISGAVGGGGDPTRVMNYEARASGFASVPDNVKTLGDASDFALKVNQANKARTGSAGSSAMGVYQIVGETLRNVAPTVLGADWRNKPFDFAAQDAVAKKIFENTKGNPEALRKQWTSLDPATAKRIAGQPWEVARQAIAAGESSSSPADLARGSSLAQQGNTNFRMARDADSLMPVYAKAAEDKRDPATLAAEQAGKGAFAGMNVAQMNQQIRLVQAEAKKQGIPALNAAVAVEVLRKSTNSTGFSQFTPGWFGTDKTGQFIDRGLVTDAIKEIKGGAIDRAVDGETQMQLNEQGQAAAKALYAAAVARRQALQVAQSQGRALGTDPRRLDVEVNRAAAALEAATGNVAKGGLFFAADKPAPITSTRSSGRQPVRQMTPAQRRLWMNAVHTAGSD